MNTEEVFSILEGIGWTCKRDEVGDRFCVCQAGENFVQIIPSIKRRSDHFRVSFMPSVSIEEFSRVVSVVSGNKRYFVPVIIRSSPPDKLGFFTRDDVVRMASEIRAWGEGQDVSAGIASMAELSSSVKGDMALRHIAALAFLGDIERLSRYKQELSTGAACFSVSYINQDMIDRALEIAKEKIR